MTAVMGTPMKRKEDPKLLTGEGKFVDDIQVEKLLNRIELFLATRLLF